MFGISFSVCNGLHCPISYDFDARFCRPCITYLRLGLYSVSRYQQQINKISRISPFITVLDYSETTGLANGPVIPQSLRVLPKLFVNARFVYHCLPLLNFEAIQPLKNPGWKLKIDFSFGMIWAMIDFTTSWDPTRNQNACEVLGLNIEGRRL